MVSAIMILEREGMSKLGLTGMFVTQDEFGLRNAREFTPAKKKF